MPFRFSLANAALIACIVLLALPTPAVAFGAGNIPSIAQIEGKNWRHGDIEDMLKTVAFIKGHKWTSMNIKRVYFGNWLRDYSQAVDVGSLKGTSAPVIRILVWILSFMSFGYATAEFEVTAERLGVYRPEEHIDNPKDYADNLDARTYDSRLRGPVAPAELEIDPRTGMKNYIANESGGWATSSGYVKHSIARSIHFGRVYTSGSGRTSGKEEDFCEALRCLGQALHCLEDFGAHTNYCELALRELGHHNVFPHVGTATEINLNGHRVFPLVTGTFGAVDFLHSVLGEMTDHFTQSEVDEMDVALKNAERSQAGTSDRGLFGSSDNNGGGFADLLSQIPGLGDGLASQARSLQADAQEQEYRNTRAAGDQNQTSGQPSNTIPGLPDFDAEKTAKRIYPILEFRDKVVRAINNTIAKIPGLEALVEKISETLTLFILSLLAPYVRPIIEAVSASLKKGSSTVVAASANQQFEPWNDPHSTNPTHSMLSKDHFSNYLNSCAGRVAATILQYAAPRIIYAWQTPGVPVDEVTNDILRAFHHPAIRNENVEIQRNMFNTVRQWAQEQPDRSKIDRLLSSASVKEGHNHTGTSAKGHDDHSHGMFGGHGKNANSIWSEIKTRDLGDMYEQRPAPTPSPRPSSSYGQNPDYGYSTAQSSYQAPNSPNSLQPDRPTSSQDGYYQSPPPPTYQAAYQQNYPQNYQQGYDQPSQYEGYQQPPPGPGGYWQPQGPPGPGYYGGPGYPGGPPPFNGGPGYGPPPGEYGQQPYGGPPGPYGQPQPPYGDPGPYGQPPYGGPGGPPPWGQPPGQYRY